MMKLTDPLITRITWFRLARHMNQSGGINWSPQLNMSSFQFSSMQYKNHCKVLNCLFYQVYFSPLDGVLSAGLANGGESATRRREVKKCERIQIDMKRT